MHRNRNKSSATETTVILSPQAEPLLIDVPAAAKLISSSKAVIRRFIRTGQLPFVPWGKKHLIAPEDLRALIARHKSGVRA
jgi:hypothetical protein